MKTVLVTGANKGIGLEVARELALKGWHVFLGARNQAAGERAGQEISQSGGKVTFLALDVADLTSVEKAARTFAATSDHLDVLINNAGVIVEGDSGILSLTDNQLRSTFETNTLGPLRVARVFRAWPQCKLRNMRLLSRSWSPRVNRLCSVERVLGTRWF